MAAVLSVFIFSMTLSSVYAQTITLTSQETMWIDANKCGAEGPQAAWLSFTVTNNTGAPLTNVTVTFAGFTGTNSAYFVAPNDLVRTFSTLAVNEVVPVYYYVDYSDVCNHPQGGGSPYAGYTANYTLTVSSTGQSNVVRNGTITTNELLTAAAAGLVQSITLGPGFFVGQTFTQTVTYSFGNNSDLFFQPAGDKAFQDGCIRLIGSECTATTGGVTGILGVKNRLHFPAASVPGGGGTITIVYTWQILCIYTAQTLHPWAAAKSGQKYKYEGIADVPTIFPPSTQGIAISKSVNPTFLTTPTSNGGFGTGIAQWNVTLTNSTGVDIFATDIRDLIPSCMTISNATVTGSQVTTANSASYPSTGSTGSQKWVGLFSSNYANNNYKVPANGTLSLIYQTSVSSCATSSNYTNSATATVGTTIVGPATATLAIGCATPSIGYSGSPFCQTGTASVTRTGFSGGIYSSTAGLSIDPATGLINLANSDPGTYTVTYAVTSPCAVSTTTSITINPLPTLSFSQTNVNCFGGLTGSATVTASGATAPYTYSWSPSGGTGATATNLAAGTYTVTVTDTKGCIKSGSVTIIQPAAALSALITAQTNVNCFGGLTGSATVTASGGTSPYSYSWSPSGGTSATATALAAGTYTVTVTDNKGCTTTATATITQPSALSALEVVTNSTCYLSNDGSIGITVLGGTAPYSFLWSNGATTEDISSIYAGNYSVTITDVRGCILIKNYTVGASTCLIDAINDTGSSINGYVGGTSFTNILSNDLLNGSPVNPLDVTLSFVSSTIVGVSLSGTNVVVAPGTPAGNYTLTYQICEVLNPTNCDQATVTVPVAAAPIDAVRIQAP
jgi:hypothetical protein